MHFWVKNLWHVRPSFDHTMHVIKSHMTSQLKLRSCAWLLNNRITSSRFVTSFDERVPHIENSSSRSSWRGKQKAKFGVGTMPDGLKEIAASTKVLSASEWLSLKERAASDWNIAERSFESQMMVACCACRNYSLGRSLMSFVGHANLVILAKYMRLCADSRDECSSEDEILSVYAELCRRHSVFDVMTAVDVVHGMCATSRWKDSLALVDTIRLTCSSVPNVIFEDLAMAAFRNGEFDLGWEFLRPFNVDWMANVSDDVFLTLMSLKETDLPMMERLFAYLKDRNFLVPQAVALEMKSWFKRRIDEEWRVSFSQVDNDGICLQCGVQLEDVRLSEADFEDLRSNFMARVIRGEDIYLKTNPCELDKFQRFVSRTSPYTIVVDGLNIAFAQKGSKASASSLAQRLLTVVSRLDREYRQQNARKILILGRHHMGRWPRSTMKQIEELAHVFFIDNLSKDDPFMLYAAMHSGQGTYFVSDDFMRDHLFSLRDARLKGLFRRWQAGHQLQTLSSNPFNPSNFKTPTRYRVAVQGSMTTSGTVWHIPYDDGSTRLPHEPPNAWLCISQHPNRSSALVHKKRP